MTSWARVREDAAGDEAVQTAVERAQLASRQQVGEFLAERLAWFELGPELTQVV